MSARPCCVRCAGSTPSSSSTRTPRTQFSSGFGRMSSRRAGTTASTSFPRRACSLGGAARRRLPPSSKGARRPGCLRKQRLVAELGTVIVTGGASGLGAAVVAGVAEAGGAPFVLDRAPPRQDVAHSIVDLSDTARAADAVEEGARVNGGVKGVVTCAGTDACGRLEECATGGLV